MKLESSCFITISMPPFTAVSTNVLNLGFKLFSVIFRRNKKNEFRTLRRTKMKLKILVMAFIEGRGRADSNKKPRALKTLKL